MKTTETTTSNKEEIEKALFLFNVAVKSDEVIQKSNERLTDKIRSFMSISAALIPIIIGVGYYILKQPMSDLAFLITSSLFLLSLASLVVAIVLGVYLQRPLAYRVFDPYTMIKKHAKKSQTYIITKYAVTWSRIVKRNSRKINYKHYYVNVMLALICFSLAVLVLTFFLLAVIQ